MIEAPITLEADARESGRVQPYWLNCNLGLLLDLSAGGARIIARRSLVGKVKMRIWDKSAGVSLQAMVVRSKRVRFRQHEVAVRFIDKNDEASARLSEIASRVNV
jgi:hypothetical protein